MIWIIYLWVTWQFLILKWKNFYIIYGTKLWIYSILLFLESNLATWEQNLLKVFLWESYFSIFGHVTQFHENRICILAGTVWWKFHARMYLGNYFSVGYTCTRLIYRLLYALKGAWCNFSKFGFLFHLKNHHSL